MGKTTRALSGASKDAYFRDVLLEEGELAAGARERLVGRFQKGVSQLRVRIGDGPRGAADVAEATEDAVDSGGMPGFDPFTPNVIVVLRREGREALLAQLIAVGRVEHLRLIAREQQLSIGDDVVTVAEIADALVTAAERRLANRRAAAR